MSARHPRTARPPRGDPSLVRLTGRRKWYVRWTPPGSRRNQVVSTGIEGGSHAAPPAAARAFLDNFVRQLAAPPDSATIADMLDARLAEAKGRVAAWRNMRLFHNQLKSRLGHLAAADWSAALNDDYIRARPPAAARRELEELRAAFRAHARRVPASPAPAVRLPPPSLPRERIIDRAQAAALLAAATAFHVRLFIALAMVSGARTGALLELTWRRVDLDRGILDLRNPNRPVTNKRRGVVPVDPALACLLRQARAIAESDRVIEYAGRPVASIRRAFAAAAARAGLPAWVTPHVLKHSAVSWLAEAGYPADAIGDLTETDPRTVRRIYRKVNPHALRPLAAALASGLPLGPAPAPRTADAQARQAKRAKSPPPTPTPARAKPPRRKARVRTV